MIEKVTIYTDGACLGNPGPGGWGALLLFTEEEKEISGYEPDTTNNRMELLAAIKALVSLKKPMDVVLVTDSQYVRMGMTTWLAQWQRRGWKKADNKPVKNADLWQALLKAASPHRIEWRWVKGHSGVPENERVDQLANTAAKTLEY